MRTYRGFTLIEVMIVVGIIAVLAAIAVPNYRNYILRGKISEASSQLSATRVKLEQWFQDNRTYCADPAVCPGPCPASALPSIGEAKYFTYNSADTVCQSASYIIFAKGVAAQDTGGFWFTIDNTNAKTTQKADAWPSIAVPVNCWITRQDGSC
jgi:type IV pilus assembly protein PilE